MNKKNDATVSYYLVSRTEEDYLYINSNEHEQVIIDYLRSINQIDCSNLNPDQRAMAVSRIWEQMGDFEMLTNFYHGSIDYYRRAMLSCLDGQDYDRGCQSLPSRWLMLRFVWLYDKVKTTCSWSKGVDRLILLDPIIKEYYRKFSCDR